MPVARRLRRRESPVPELDELTVDVDEAGLDPGVRAATDADAPVAHGPQPVVVLPGLSGPGKTAASKLFEDLGYTVVDNVPPDLLRDLAELVANDPERYQRVALVLDVRTGNAPLALGAAMGALQGRDLEPQVYFLEASDESLIRRFSE